MSLSQALNQFAQNLGRYQSTKGFTANYESFDDRTYLRFIA